MRLPSRHPHRKAHRRLVACATAMLATTGLLAACSGDDTASPRVKAATTTRPATPIVLNGEGNNLDAYAMSPEGAFTHHRVDTNNDQNPKGWDINAQLCVFERDGKRLLIAGEDTHQPNPPPGWGIFELNGNGLDALTVKRVAKLTPTFQPPSSDNPENYGCGVLGDGRILTTDVGQQATGDDGQLIIWFPPYDGFGEGDISYCKLDVALPTAQSILVTDSDRFLVAAARGGVYQYTGPFPTDATPAGGCDGKDATGRPTATKVTKKTLVAPGEAGMATPAGLAPAPDGGFYASSVFTGVINEYGANGTFRRNILPAPPGESIGATPLSTGTPLGLGTDAEGNIWYADIGLVLDPKSGMGPGDHTGTLRVIRFANGQPQAPVTVATGLDFPDGIGTVATS